MKGSLHLRDSAQNALEPGDRHCKLLASWGVSLSAGSPRANGASLALRFTKLPASTRKGESKVLGRVYTFEREGAPSERPVSTVAAEAIRVSIHGRPGIRYYELTAPSKLKPVFAVLFPDELHKELFEDLLGPMLKLCGLRINIVYSLEERRLPTESPANEQSVSSGLDAGSLPPLLALA
jgi:hypothetical protein